MKKSTPLMTLLAISMITGYATASTTKDPNKVATQVGFVQFRETDFDKLKKMRISEIKETATILGAQGGLAWRSAHINKTLQEEASQLDNTYNFQAMLIQNRVLPPVLDQYGSSATLDNPDTIRLASKSYIIIAPARIATTAPNWRNYLLMSYTKPNAPDKTLLPQNDHEAKYWNTCLQKGWKDGIAQANAIFSANLNRLNRDYKGMILYRSLLAQHIVLPPHMAEANLGVTGNGHQIRIDDRIYRITAHASLQTNASKWSPIISGQ